MFNRSLRTSLPAIAFLALTSGALADVSGPTPAIAPKGQPPVIESVNLRVVTMRYMTVYPDFAFHDPDGDVWFIRRMLVATDLKRPLNINLDGLINILPDTQKQGAVYTGGWDCGPEKYYATLRAYMVDHAGNVSNTVEYTIHCNGG